MECQYGTICHIPFCSHSWVPLSKPSDINVTITLYTSSEYGRFRPSARSGVRSQTVGSPDGTIERNSSGNLLLAAFQALQNRRHPATGQFLAPSEILHPLTWVVYSNTTRNRKRGSPRASSKKNEYLMWITTISRSWSTDAHRRRPPPIDILMNMKRLRLLLPLQLRLFAWAYSETLHIGLTQMAEECS